MFCNNPEFINKLYKTLKSLVHWLNGIIISSIYIWYGWLKFLQTIKSAWKHFNFFRNELEVRLIKGRRKAATDGEVIGMKRAAQVPSLQGRSLYLPFWRISCLFTVVGVSVNLKKWKYLTFVSVYSFMVSVLWWCASFVLYLHVVCCWHFALSLWVSTVFSM